jgi:hypothetical protein
MIKKIKKLIERSIKSKMTYERETTKIVKEKIISSDRIFNYLETPLEVLCNSLFHYYKKLIENNSDIYNIDPNFFFFNNHTDVNAWAQVKGENSIVSINIGTINHLKTIFLDNEELIEEIFGENVQKLNKILIEEGSSIMNFMYYSAIIFLINHEIAHLIQNNQKLEFRLNESIEELENFNIDNHIYEVDADVFASQKVSQDIHRIWKRFGAEYRTDAFLSDLISLAVSAIGIFKLFNLNAEKGIYLREKSHPHVTVRYTIIAETFIDYTSHLRNREIPEGFKDLILSNSFDYIELLNVYTKDEFFEGFAALAVQHSEEIRTYSNYLLSQIGINENCVYYKFRHYND